MAISVVTEIFTTRDGTVMLRLIKTDHCHRVRVQEVSLFDD
jgi:hypothetical protein